MHEQDAEILKELMLDMVKGNAVIMSDISAIKSDLKEHMRRTATAEAEIKYLHRQVNIAHGAIGLISFIGILVAIYKNIFGH